MIKGSIQAKTGRPYWYAVLELPDKNGERNQKCISTKIPIAGNDKRKAEAALKEIIAEWEEKIVDYVDNRLFADYIAEWVERYKNKVQQSTWESYKKAVDNNIFPYFKKRKIKLQDLTQHDLNAYYDSLIKKGNSANTVKHFHANIHKCLKDAMKADLIPRNVAELVDLPKVEKYRAQHYNEKQLRTLLKAVKGHNVETAVLLACHYGLRRSEIAGLLWRNVDFDSKTITIATTRTRQTTIIQKERTKTDSSYRELPMTDEVFYHLKALKSKQARDKLFLGNGYTDNDFVCKWDNGEPFGLNYYTEKFQELAESTGLSRIRFHDLRHSFASVLCNNGVELFEAKNILGHSNISTTADIYSHLSTGRKKAALNVAAKAIAAG